MSDSRSSSTMVGSPPFNGLLGAKLATLTNVRELTEGDPVEIWTDPVGRLVVRAFNECRNNFTDVDLTRLLAWAVGNGVESDGGDLATLRSA